MTQPRAPYSFRASTLHRAMQIGMAGLVLFFTTGCPGMVETFGNRSSNAELADLEVSHGALEFDPAQTEYVVTSTFLGTSLDLTPMVADAGASVTVAGQSLVSGATARVLLAEGINSIDIVVTAEDGSNVLIYSLVYVRDNSASFAQDVYVKASNTEASDEFGNSVAMSGDTLAVGVLTEDSSATGIDGDEADNSAAGSGAVFVFSRDRSGAWSQEAYIKASNTGSFDQFGISVALSGDTLVVGAPFEDSFATGIGGNEPDNSAASSGAVYVFGRDSQGIWSQEAYIKASNTDASDAFGTSVALSGNTLAVGAPHEGSSAAGIDGNGTDNSSASSGAAYAFRRDSQGLWSQEAYIKASNTGAGDQFGYAVALSADMLVVGAYREDSSATGIGGDEADNAASNSGAVYLFRRDTSGMWAQEAYIKASNTGADDTFGFTVALSDSSLAVGAQGEDSNATGIDGDEANNSDLESGAVYAYGRDSQGTWSQAAYIKASNSEGADGFGYSLALFAGTLAVGVRHEDSSATGVGGDEADNAAPSSGAVYIFERDHLGAWSQALYAKASNTEFDDQFGFSVALSADTLAVGAPFEDSSATDVSGDESDNSSSNSGAVYVFQ